MADGGKFPIFPRKPKTPEFIEMIDNINRAEPLQTLNFHTSLMAAAIENYKRSCLFSFIFSEAAAFRHRRAVLKEFPFVKISVGKTER